MIMLYFKKKIIITTYPYSLSETHSSFICISVEHGISENKILFDYKFRQLIFGKNPIGCTFRLKSKECFDINCFFFFTLTLNKGYGLFFF